MKKLLLVLATVFTLASFQVCEGGVVIKNLTDDAVVLHWSFKFEAKGATLMKGTLILDPNDQFSPDNGIVVLPGLKIALNGEWFSFDVFARGVERFYDITKKNGSLDVIKRETSRNR